MKKRYSIWISGMMLAFGLVVLFLVSGTEVLVAQDRSEQEENCFLLEEQFKKAIEAKADSPAAAEARKLGEDGIRRCKGGASEFGVNLLSEALEKLGEVPKTD